MDNLPVVIFIISNTLVKSRIKNVFTNQDIKIYEASSRKELLRILSATNYKVDLVVTELAIDSQNGFSGIELIKLVKSKRSSIPVVILSSESRKVVITRCLLEGAADYILKPFQDEFLKEKLLKYIDIENLTESTILQFSFKDFLGSEIYKAKKGDYPFSLLKIRFDSSSAEESASRENNFYNYAESIYNEIKSLFWESDLYIRHGYQCHLGFFPFCGKGNVEIIIKKIASAFEHYKLTEPNTCDYSITYTFSTYPSSGETASDLLSNLSAKM